ncbi:MAG: TspO/MBR family protein [Candidatus Micrarchaeia archaeon]
MARIAFNFLKGKQLWMFAASLAVVFIAALIGSIFTIASIPTWYAQLAKPAFTPPSWVFGPAWTVLYVLMAVSFFLVWEKGFKGSNRNVAIGVYGLQLCLNVLWSVVFFGMRSPLSGLFVIALLWLSIAATIAVFWRISKTASWLLVPYILWVSFASVLNYYVWILN